LKVEHGPQIHEAGAKELRHRGSIVAGHSVNSRSCISSPLDNVSALRMALEPLGEVQQMRLVVAIDYGTTYTGKVYRPAPALAQPSSKRAGPGPGPGLSMCKLQSAIRYLLSATSAICYICHLLTFTCPNRGRLGYHSRQSRKPG
jgi:hypothetical protein